jgi:hypothetical protein
MNEFEPETPQPFLLRDVLPGPGWAPYRAAAFPLPQDREVAAKPYEEDGCCMKGLLVGIGLEGAAAMGIYGLWQLWHLIR